MIESQDLAARDTLDWRSLYERYASEIARYLLKVTGEIEVARDLVQETFVRGIEREGQLRERSLVRSWLYRIATNLAMSHLRRRRFRERLGFAPTEGADHALLTAEADQVRRSLRAIPPAHATCLILRERGFSRREIAAICGVSEEAVKSRLSRGESNFVAAYRRLERGLKR